MNFLHFGNEFSVIEKNVDVILSIVWIQEINKAARGENLIEKPNYPEMYKLLGLNMKDNPDAAEISRAYRKKALRCHPDKGGDMLEVNIFPLFHHCHHSHIFIFDVVQEVARCIQPN